ncbi:hypothetical protein Hanom_Chr10g00898101 [Helianthus anomalus]
MSNNRKNWEVSHQWLRTEEISGRDTIVSSGSGSTPPAVHVVHSGSHKSTHIIHENFSAASPLI